MWWPRWCRALRLEMKMSEKAAAAAAGGGKRKEAEAGTGEQPPPVKRPRGTGARVVPPPVKRKAGFSLQQLSETRSYLEGGLRKVEPYYFDFCSHCKGRWVGQSLLHVFSNEFRAEPIEYYHQAAAAGRIRLNEQPADLSTILQNNDFMRNTVHRHEPPVTAEPIRLLANTEQVVVVDKPASLPVHPCGRFRHNSVIFILAKEHGLSGLHTIHRLDRLTSGVLIFAKTLAVSKKLDQQVRDRQVHKEYVCRVEGKFPEGEITCEEPILVVSYKLGVCRVDPKGKRSRTVFRLVCHSGSSSLVRCFPITGRTHQIRVHLQYLGHPILSDPVYNSPAWGPDRARGGHRDKSDSELLEALIAAQREKEGLDLLGEGGLWGEQGSGGLAGSEGVGKSGVVPGSEGAGNEGAGAGSERAGAGSERAGAGREGVGAGSEGVGSRPQGVKDPLCGECKLVRTDPSPGDLMMYLHALRYKTPDWEYATELPSWAREDWPGD
ncbi:RNA pseudouridylate synthase domain-containing protein 2 [Callorhinchus milii]|uniref:RNA pseudouridylate synthase domain-containing protein 2 n=1 Tax=Callorhinchus milii TaxID=7868 RepID=UPI001C3FBA34|nr:RNA pseudouridylate synthase domain-containing protein 2 [Callorhinchus milii]